MNNKGIRRRALFIRQAKYQEFIHPAVRKFWEELPADKKHMLSQHQLFKKHGKNLSVQAFNWITERVAESGSEVADMNETFSVLSEILVRERAHKTELENLAKDVVSKIWGIDRSMLDAELTASPSAEIDESPKLKELSPEIQHQINKRITLNSLTHGAAVHQMHSMHYLIDNAIRKIDPKLLQLYSKLSLGSMQQYWTMDVPSIVELNNLDKIAGGTERIEFDEQDNPKVHAEAICFPVLAQELSKGVMELLTMHGLEDLDEETAATVINYADNLRDEIWLIQVGQELWRKFIQVIPENISLAEVVAKFSKKTPHEVRRIINAVVDNPAKARAHLALIAETEDKDNRWEIDPEQENS